MKRRQAILNMFLLTGAAAGSFGVFKWYGLYKKPDLELLRSHKSLIAELAETIIPATDTPGAKAAKVEEFILHMVLYCEDTKEQNRFINGLNEIQSYTLRNYKQPFQKCTASDRIEILSHFEERAVNTHRIINKIQSKLFGERFFYQLKNMTITGYCTSELGATQGMAYDEIPVHYQACIPLLPMQKSWATK